MFWKFRNKYIRAYGFMCLPDYRVHLNIGCPVYRGSSGTLYIYHNSLYRSIRHQLSTRFDLRKRFLKASCDNPINFL